MKATSKSQNRTRTAKQPPVIKIQPVHFELHDPAARRVCIAGSFNDWHPEGIEMISMGSGMWALDLELAPGTYEYRFIIDGRWMTDPHCARTAPNAFGETNSLLVVPEPIPTPLRASAKSFRSPVPPLL